MNTSRFWVLIVLSVLAAQSSHTQDVGASSAASAPSSSTTAKGSLLDDFLDPEFRFAEGCGCYMKRATAAERRELVFFGKLGDEKESGWISLKGQVTEVPKQKPDSERRDTGKTVRTKYYRSADVAVQLELVLQQAKTGDEVATYTGELTVMSAGRTEKVAIAGECGC